MSTLIPKYDQGATGAVNRAINLKLAEIVSVKDFGATGNGTTDDSAAIQLAIDAAFVNGASVYFPAGSYLVNSQVDLKNKVSLFGAGKTSSEIWFGATGQFKLTGVDGTNIGFFTIQDMGLTNQGGGATFCLSLNYAERVTLFNCVVYNTGLAMSAFSYVTVDTCDLFSGELYADHPIVDRISEALKILGCNGSGFKINVKDTADVFIDNCSFLGANAGVTIQRGEQPAGFYPPVFITNTVIDATADECLILNGVCPHVTNCFISGGRTNLKNGIVLSGCTEGAIVNTQVRFCGNDGLWIGFSDNITVTGSIFNDNKRNGVRVGDSNNLRFIGNTMSDVPTWFGGRYPQVTGFTDEPSNSTYLTLTDNNVTGNTSAGIYAPSVTNTITGNNGYGQNSIINPFLLSILKDGVTAPLATVGEVKIFVDTADGDLKIIFGDGTVKTIVTD
jgi:parallel beta-helix repeat protein